MTNKEQMQLYDMLVELKNKAAGIRKCSDTFYRNVMDANLNAIFKSGLVDKLRIKTSKEEQ